MKPWQHFSLFIDDNSRNKIIQKIDKTEFDYLYQESDKVYINSCKLLHISEASTPSGYPIMVKLNSLIKKGLIEFSIKVNAIGISDKAMALRVYLPKKLISYNENPFIPVCTYNDGDLSDCRDIINWYSLEKPFEITVKLSKI